MTDRLLAALEALSPQDRRSTVAVGALLLLGAVMAAQPAQRPQPPADAATSGRRELAAASPAPPPAARLDSGAASGPPGGGAVPRPGVANAAGASGPMQVGIGGAAGDQYDALRHFWPTRRSGPTTRRPRSSSRRWS
jgi:uncharacterized membrane protein